jgi:hypothetical protein
MRDVIEARKLLNVEWASAPDEYRAMAIQVHEQYVEDFNMSPEPEGADAPPDIEQVLRWVVAANSDAWTAVRKKWRLGGHIGVDFFIELLGAYHLHYMNGLLTSSVEDMAQTVQQHPEPVYQKVYLLDLPTEMIHRIMTFVYKRDAMCLGSACHRLHEIASNYVFEASFHLF